MGVLTFSNFRYYCSTGKDFLFSLSSIIERNWNGNVELNGTPTVPESIEALCRVVRDSPPPILVLGRGHSFTSLAECSGGRWLSLVCFYNGVDFTLPSEGCVLSLIT